MSVGKRMVQAAGIVLVVNLVSRILGFVRDVVIAAQFGASSATDAFMVAYTIPYFLQAIMGMAFVMVIVPVLAEYQARGEREEMWKVASLFINWTAVVLAAATLVGMLISGGLVRIMAPGFSPGVSELARQLTVIMFPSILFMGLGMLVTGILNAHYFFGVPASAPAINNVVVILAVVLFGSRFGIYGLAAGTLGGFICFLLIQLPTLRRLDFKYTFSLDYRHPVLKKAAIGIGPIIFGVGVNQIYLTLNRFFASMVAVGSIAAIDFAFRLIFFPLGVFAAAVSTVIFPNMSERAAVGDRQGLQHALVQGLNLVALIAVPSAVGLMVLHTPVVQLLYERGAFDAHATQMTGSALLYLSIGMLAWGADMILTRIYYAVGDIRTPMLTGIISVVIDIGLSVLLLPLMGHAGLTLANSLAVTSNCLLLYFYLTRHVPNLDPRGVLVPLLKIGLGSAVMGAVVFAEYRVLSFPLLIDVGACILTGLLVYAAAVLLLKVDELQLVKRAFADRFHA